MNTYAVLLTALNVAQTIALAYIAAKWGQAVGRANGVAQEKRSGS